MCVILCCLLSICTIYRQLPSTLIVLPSRFSLKEIAAVRFSRASVYNAMFAHMHIHCSTCSKYTLRTDTVK